MYSYLLGAGAAGSMLAAYKLYQRYYNQQPPLHSIGTVFESAEDLFAYLGDENTEPDFSRFQNMLDRLLDLIDVKSDILQVIGIWRVEPSQDKVATYEKSLNANDNNIIVFDLLSEQVSKLNTTENELKTVAQALFHTLKTNFTPEIERQKTRFTNTQELNSSLQKNINDTTALQQALDKHLKQLMTEKHFKQASVLHNLFHLLSQTDKNSERNSMPAKNLSIILLPWMQGLLQRDDLSLEDYKSGQAFYEKIMSAIVTSKTFQVTFKQAVEQKTYQVTNEQIIAKFKC